MIIRCSPTAHTEWSSCFPVLVSFQCKEGGFPHDLWLSVSAENVSVYKRGEPKPLETFPYEHIIFFGAPQPCTYKITVDEREMFFDTPQVRHVFCREWKQNLIISAAEEIHCSSLMNSRAKGNKFKLKPQSSALSAPEWSWWTLTILSCFSENPQALGGVFKPCLR